MTVGQLLPFLMNSVWKTQTRLQDKAFTFSGYESQFDKKSFGEELEMADLNSFFKECDLYPSKLEIDEGMDVTTQGKIVTYTFAQLSM